MKHLTTYLASILLVLSCLTSTICKADGGKSKTEITWTRWELSPVADIYYRMQIVKDSAEASMSKTISVEFLNNYKKEVSFCFAINDNGQEKVEHKFVINLKKKKTAITDYPRPKEISEMKISITSLELGK